MFDFFFLFSMCFSGKGIEDWVGFLVGVCLNMASVWSSWKSNLNEALSRLGFWSVDLSCYFPVFSWQTNGGRELLFLWLKIFSNDGFVCGVVKRGFWMISSLSSRGYKMKAIQISWWKWYLFSLKTPKNSLTIWPRLCKNLYPVPLFGCWENCSYFLLTASPWQSNQGLS